MNKEANAPGQQVGGEHYSGQSKSGQQHWDMSWDFGLDGFQHTITKYVMRWRQKAGLQDLQKARHCIDKYIELVTLNPATDGTLDGPTDNTLKPADEKFQKWVSDNADRLRRLMWGERFADGQGKCTLCNGTDGNHEVTCERAAQPTWLFKDGELVPVDPITGAPWTGPINPASKPRMTQQGAASGQPGPATAATPVPPGAQPAEA